MLIFNMLIFNFIKSCFSGTLIMIHALSFFLVAHAHGQPNELIAGRYEVLGDGSEIKDKQTDLIWQRCSVGQRWEKGTCSGEAKMVTFDEARSLSKKGGWRVPTIRELASLVKCRRKREASIDLQDGYPAIRNGCAVDDYQAPSIDEVAFPNVLPNSSYWSSSWNKDEDQLDIPSMWFIYSNTGEASKIGLHLYQFHVRLVRINQLTPCTQAKPQSNHLIAGRYEVLGDGSEIKDKQTGLIWQRCSIGQRWDGGCVGDAKEFSFGSALQTPSKDGWRVPTIRELASLIKCSSETMKNETDLQDGGEVIKNGCVGHYQQPTIDVIAFPNTINKHYWSSSFNGVSVVDFHYGVLAHVFRHFNAHVRLVCTDE